VTAQAKRRARDPFGYLFRTARPLPREPELARALVLRHGWHTVAYQILNPGIAHWLAPDHAAVVGYVAAGGTWVAAGAPVGPPERLAELAAAFEAAAARHGQRVCYFGAQAGLAELLAARAPLARLKVGAQPVWDPRGWLNLLTSAPALRAQIARARNKGLIVQCRPAAEAARDGALRVCLEQWLARRGLPPMGFLVEPLALAAPEDRQVFVALRQGAPLAYLLATPIPQRNGWLLEQLVRGPDAPNGVAELLIDAAMRALGATGASYLTLGLAPLATRGHADAEIQPAHVRLLLNWARTHGRRFYNFAGLEAFRSRLRPDAWEPIYLLSRERTTSLRTLYAVAAAFGGAPPPIFLGRALLRVVRN
jgi:phosphatidylglycerol lysyltransferase